MEILDGKITRIDERGLTIHVPYTNFQRACLRQYDAVQVGLPDGRTISPEQRKKAHAIINEIADWTGELPDYQKRIMKFEFIATRMQSLEKELFSLSSCDVTTAKDFITFLIDFVVEHGVPCKFPLYEMCEDIQRYVWINLMKKRCAVCGKDHADLHHFDQIGMGADRDTKYQIGMRVISLCREHHGEAHSNGRTWLTDTLHLEPIPLSAEIGKVYGLTKRNLTKE